MGVLEGERTRHTWSYGADSRYVQIVNPKGEMKGSAITGPVGKEAAELWPVSILLLSLRPPTTTKY